ncbi:1,2-phenylacetyl-CoA epoxidase subunit PaaD [Shouchella sp. JSM 1781072]|uniref:1,2-phenylacetyl-CoA epoxidase subunit PaaD n=1 Tax=Bacillaceae TaxID=186817 RepID=UPI000C082212|nr:MULTISPECIES: 1,2-phenylacetyl-CoA epoxidase subunit PaaD [Bacillaceae]UTR07290.1 phenylacetate-CoA oxygenase subunit PaaJ [Alkalihalobacillus sp. LMS6]
MTYTETNIVDFELIMEQLETVKDPEIDTVSIIDLGMVERLNRAGATIDIDILPTFLGCPALPIIQKNIKQALLSIPSIETVNVSFVHSPPWTSDRINEKGQQGLKAFGIAPPPEFLEADGSWHIDCPYCSSTYVTLDNLFGPTACRSILYCKSCKNPFEAMKPVSTL